MNQSEALQNLINGVEKGQSSGIYTFEEASLLWESIKSFFPTTSSTDVKTPQTTKQNEKKGGKK